MRVRTMLKLTCGFFVVAALLVTWIFVIPYLQVYPIVKKVRELGGSVGKRSIVQQFYIPTWRTIDKIDFRGADINDADLAALSSDLARLPRLKYLILSDTNVTDAGLRHLRELDTLEYIYLHGTNVTQEGVMYLKRELPNAWRVAR